MKPVEAFFTDLDSRWNGPAPGRTPLRIIGSAALMLQADYERRTKDSDVLETRGMTADIKERLLGLAGRGTDFARRHGMYLDIVLGALPLLPQQAFFHPVAGLGRLRHFSIEVLDVVDVVVSKLRRFNADDSRDVAAMVQLGKVPHDRLIERFKAAVDMFSTDARAQDLPRCVSNLNAVELDCFAVAKSDIELPDWI